MCYTYSDQYRDCPFSPLKHNPDFITAAVGFPSAIVVAPKLAVLRSSLDGRLTSPTMRRPPRRSLNLDVR